VPLTIVPVPVLPGRITAAEIVAVPAETPVASPLALTVATPAALELQYSPDVSGALLPSL
jgi:hypothetical protein